MALKAYKLFMETRLGSSGEAVHSVASCSKCNQMVAREININEPSFSLSFVQIDTYVSFCSQLFLKIKEMYCFFNRAATVNNNVCIKS